MAKEQLFGGHGQSPDMRWSVHTLMLEALYGVDGTSHGKRDE